MNDFAPLPVHPGEGWVPITEVYRDPHWPSCFRARDGYAKRRNGCTVTNVRPHVTPEQKELYAASLVIATRFRSWSRIPREEVRRFLDAVAGAS